jgi:hypothetical protein
MSVSLEMHRRIRELSPEARRVFQLGSWKANRLLTRYVAELEKALQKAEEQDAKND